MGDGGTTSNKEQTEGTKGGKYGKPVEERWLFSAAYSRANMHESGGIHQSAENVKL